MSHPISPEDHLYRTRREGSHGTYQPDKPAKAEPEPDLSKGEKPDKQDKK